MTVVKQAKTKKNLAAETKFNVEALSERAMKFKYLMARRRWVEIESLMWLPLLILLWWLGYKTGFALLVAIMIVNAFGTSRERSKREKQLGLYIKS